MKCELLDYWSVLDFDVTGQVSVRGGKELDSPVNVRENLFVLFIYNQLSCQCPS